MVSWGKSASKEAEKDKGGTKRRHIPDAPSIAHVSLPGGTGKSRERQVGKDVVLFPALRVCVCSG